MTDFAPLKIQSQRRRERPAARDFRLQVQRIEPVILVGEIQHAKAEFGAAVWKNVAGENILLPEIIAGQSGRVAVVVLMVPVR